MVLLTRKSKYEEKSLQKLIPQPSFSRQIQVICIFQTSLCVRPKFQKPPYTIEFQARDGGANLSATERRLDSAQRTPLNKLYVDRLGLGGTRSTL